MIVFNKMTEQLNIPSKKYEKWRYSDLTLLEQPIHYHSRLIKNFNTPIQSNNFYYIVITDGKYLKDKSILPKEGIKISQIEKDNIKNFAKFEEKYQVKQNLENSKHLIYIHIDKNIDKPVKLLKLITPNCNTFSTYIKLDNNCNIKLIEEFASDNVNKGFINNFTKVDISTDSSMKHFIQKDLDEEFKSLYTLETSCDNNANYENYSINSHYKSYRFESEVHLNGKHSSANFYGVCIANFNQIYDCVIDIKHNASDTFSNQHYNQVLNNNSSGSFYSNVYIPKFLNSIEAHQLNKNLILDGKSKAYSRPMLDINSDDVVCSHGSTTGNIQPEILNYFAARGIKDFQAKNLIVIGLLKSVFLDCNLEEFEIENLYSQIFNSI